jgi:CRISPR system Cascade subunit CasA
MTYDLRREPWIPWRRRSGMVEWGPPAMLVSQIGDDPVVALATPRPDFDGALQEFLIGLLTVALAPAGEADWQALWDDPPTVETLQKALEALPPAFDLDGEGPRFFQDLGVADFTDTEPGSIEQILIETPGDQTRLLNKDLFVKRDRAARLGRPAAAMALLTLQTYAPAGGAGHRTSMRGGGPLTTLVDPRVDREGRSQAHAQPLWRKLWANVETAREAAARAPAGGPRSAGATFPWLAPTRVSTKGSPATSPSDASPLQAYFGLPRRIRLEFGEAGRCDITGVDDDATVTGFRMRNYGVQYQGWKHPLSPHYRTKADEEWLAVHPQPGGLGWRDWVSLAVRAAEGGLREPAATVARFNKRGRNVGIRSVRLHAFGYDMDNMKARGWLEATLPAFAVDDERQALLLNAGVRLTDAAGMASTALLGAVKAALFQSPDDARGDFTSVRGDLWSATEHDFYDTIAAIASPALDEDAAESLAAECRADFAALLAERATAVFDRWCPVAGLAPEPMRRRVAARYQLVSTLRGYSKLGEKLFEALGIPAPGGGQAARSKTRSRKEVAK